MKSLKFVLFHAKRYTRELATTVAAMLGMVGAGLLIPWIVKNLLTILQSGGDPDQILREVTLLALLALAIYLLRWGLSFAQDYFAHIAGYGVVADVRMFIYERMQRFTLRFYDDRQTGQLMTLLVDDTAQFEEMIARTIPSMLVSVATLVGVVGIVFALDWRLALLALIPIPFIVLAMQAYTRYVKPVFRKRQTAIGNINSTAVDNLSGIRDIKAFTREKIEARHFNEKVEIYRSLSLKAIKMRGIFRPAVDFTASMGTLIVLYFGGRLALSGTIELPVLVAFFLYIGQLYAPVQSLANSWDNTQRMTVSANRIAEIMDEEPEVMKASGTIKLEGKAEGAVTYRDVSFSYKGEIPVLEHIDLEIPAKSVVAMVGPSGVGKSTLVSLIPRFYDVRSGEILLDGRDVKTLALKSLRRQVSIVLQDVFLFHGTVRENILFGNRQSSEEKMIEAAKAANAHDFISAMQDGYDTLIGERGVKLSGGQKQRISIARALLKDAPILILDEATSSVDTETEMLIQQALERLMAGRTTIIIAHRLSTIRNADKIVVLDDRHIVEAGTHAELIAKDGLYAKLSRVQGKMENEEREYL